MLELLQPGRVQKQNHIQRKISRYLLSRNTKSLYGISLSQNSKSKPIMQENGIVYPQNQQEYCQSCDFPPPAREAHVKSCETLSCIT